MSTSIVHRFVAARQAKQPPLIGQENLKIRRIFNNEQLIERFDKWLQVCGKSKNTRINYALSVRQFGRFLNKPLTTATREDIRAWLAELLAKGRAPGTMQLRLDSLRTFFDCLQLGSQVRDCAPRLLSRRKLPKHLPRTLSEEEINRLIAAARSPRDLAILELAYASGLRVNELATLRREDVNLKAGSLIVRQGKGGDDRIALFGSKAAAALREYLGDRQTGVLFRAAPRRQRGSVWCDRKWRTPIWFGQWRETDDNGKRVMRTVRLGDYDLPTKERARIALDAYLADKLPHGPKEIECGLTARQIERIVKAAAKRAGLTAVHPHTLRHCMATHLINRGADIRHVQELLGHTSLVATQKYLHMSPVSLKAVHTKFFQRG